MAFCPFLFSTLMMVVINKVFLEINQFIYLFSVYFFKQLHKYLC